MKSPKRSIAKGTWRDESVRSALLINEPFGQAETIVGNTSNEKLYIGN